MSTVSIVHCIDTEGPLNEPTEATFERIRFILNIKELDLEPTRINLEKILSGEIELKNDKGVSALDIISPHLLKLNSTWDKIYEMFEKIEDSKIRFQILKLILKFNCKSKYIHSRFDLKVYFKIILFCNPKGRMQRQHKKTSEHKMSVIYRVDRGKESV